MKKKKVKITIKNAQNEKKKNEDQLSNLIFFLNGDLTCHVSLQLTKIKGSMIKMLQDVNVNN